MSVPTINRSLTTIRSELEFLLDSNVLTQELHDALIQSLPRKYQEHLEPYGLDKLPSGRVSGNSGNSERKSESLSEDINKLNITPPVQPPSAGRTPEPKPLGYCEALYDYNSQERGDLNISKGDKLVIVEHLSQDWWKGYKDGASSKNTGVFPSNYVKSISESDISTSSGKEKAGYTPQNSYSQSPPQYQANLQQPQAQQLSNQTSYGGYAQFPPPSTNYYPPQQPLQQQPVQQQQQAQPEANANNNNPQHNEYLKKFGSKLGNAAIFGAGATIGSDIVHSIF